MRRRLDLAGALVARPPVLFLDEPTTGLDPRSRSDLWTVIADLVQGGTTLLLTTQYLEEAERLADNILVIDHGTAIAEGTADELKAKVGGERLELLASTEADVETILSTIVDVGSDRPAIDGRRICLPVATGPKALMEAVRRLDEIEIELHDVALRRPTLDDVFLALTGHGAEESDRNHRGGTAMTMAMTLSDGWTVTRRNLFAMSRNPEVVIWSTIQPIMFIVLFVYVFDSIPTPGLDYVDYVMAGIFVQTVMFNSALTGVGLATDIQKGIIDRFRSLPMARSAVLVGRTTGDIVNGLAQLVVMVVVGFIVGWRTDASPPSVIAGLLLVLVDRLRVQLDLGDRRPQREVRRSGQLGGVRVDVPGDVRVEHVRRHQHAFGGGAHHRRVEPDVGVRPRRPRAVRQHVRRDAATRRVAAAEPDPGDAAVAGR